MTQRIANEIKHGDFIANKGEEVWNWSSAAGQVRRKRRCDLFTRQIGDNNKKVLEIGCGTGLFTQELVKTNNCIYALDIAENLLNIAKKRIQADNVQFVAGNACQTDFAEASFDFIVGNSILHHLDIDTAIKELFRLLKPGGKVILSEPNMLNPWIALQKNIPFLKKLAGDSPDETAFFRWPLEKKFIKSGFADITVKPFDFLHPYTPKSLIKAVNQISLVLEKLPLIKELSGSLLIIAKK